MKITPKTEDQIKTEGLCPEGWHEASVEHAEEEVSKKGNDMLKLRLRLYLPDGERVMFDYLLDAFAFKLRHFCEAAGLLDEYNRGVLKAEQCVGKLVMAEIRRKVQKTGEYAGQTQAQVSDYKAVVRKTGTPDHTKPATQKAMVGDPIQEDDIPF